MNDDRRTTGSRSDRSRKLHLDPTVSWGHLLTTAGMVIAAISAWTSMGERLTLNESEVAHNRELIQFVQAQTKEDRIELKQSISAINTKLDKLIQSRLRP